jgi:hypothetical protein
MQKATGLYSPITAPYFRFYKTRTYFLVTKVYSHENEEVQEDKLGADILRQLIVYCY